MHCHVNTTLITPYPHIFVLESTVEPLLTDIPNSGHLPNNGYESVHQPYFPLQNQPPTSGHISTPNKG